MTVKIKQTNKSIAIKDHQSEHQTHVILKAPCLNAVENESKGNTYHHIVVPKKFQLSQIDSSYKGKEKAKLRLKQRERGIELSFYFSCFNYYGSLLL